MIIKEDEGQILQKYNFNFKKGSVEMLILRLLSNHDCYGYQLTQIIKKLSDGLIIIPSGSLYPILYKLLDEGYITEYAVKSGRRQERIYYHLEPSGEEYLEEQIVAYRAVENAIARILSYEGEEKNEK